MLSGLDDEALAIRRCGRARRITWSRAGRRPAPPRSLRYAIERKRAEVERGRFEREQAARRHAEAARQRLEELAAERAAILAQIAEGVVVADATGMVTFANESARRLHGGSAWTDRHRARAAAASGC